MSTCEFCGDEVSSHKKFCSKSCYGKSISNSIDRVCELCDTEFTTVPSRDKKYCSRKCFGKDNRNGRFVDCSNCGDAVWKEQNEIERSDNNFCSNSCNNEFQENKITTKCDNCENEIKHRPSNSRRFCDASCFGEYMSKKVERNCSNCDNIVKLVPAYSNKYENTFCDKNCMGEWMSENSLFATDENPNLKDGRYGDFGSNWLEVRDKVIEKFDNTCAHCGMGKESNGRNMSVHHIKPRSEFINSDEHKVEESNKMSNLVALCRGCHMKAEHGNIEVKKYV